jgi:hypothetical protein
MSKTIFKYPKGSQFTAMWGQISGMADCCGAGVIGRLSGIKQNRTELLESDAPTITEPYKKFTSMRDYIMLQLPRNQLFAGKAEYLHWAIVEDLLSKKESGVHTPQIKAAGVDKHKFDFEGNPYHKFWAGPGYKVQMWFITDRFGKYMSHHQELCCNAFMDFIHKYQLGKVWKSDKIPGSYGTQELWGAVYHPAYSRIEERLAKVIAEANKEMEERWKKVAPFVKGTKAVKDEVAKKW